MNYCSSLREFPSLSDRSVACSLRTFKCDFDRILADAELVFGSGDVTDSTEVQLTGIGDKPDCNKCVNISTFIFLIVANVVR